MDIFMKVLGFLLGAAFFYLGLRFLFQSTKVIQGIQRYKYKTTATPRKQELIFAKVIGVLLLLFASLFLAYMILSLIP